MLKIKWHILGSAYLAGRNSCRVYETCYVVRRLAGSTWRSPALVQFHSDSAAEAVL